MSRSSKYKNAPSYWLKDDISFIPLTNLLSLLIIPLNANLIREVHHRGLWDTNGCLVLDCITLVA